MDKDFSPKDQDKDKDFGLKDKDLKLVLKELLRTRTKTIITARHSNTLLSSMHRIPQPLQKMYGDVLAT